MELIEAIESLTESSKALTATTGQWSEWRSYGGAAGRFHAVVLDTNVLLRHREELSEIEWFLGLDIFPHFTIAHEARSSKHSAPVRTSLDRDGS